MPKYKIYITSGKGSGETELGAFDAALWDAGISDYNLIYLSSIIPANSEVIETKLKRKQGEIGHKLYVIMSEKTATKPGEEAWAGFGWVYDESGGIFVHCQGSSKEESKALIDGTFNTMRRYRGFTKYGKINYSFQGIKCEKEPACAIVVAVLDSDGWKEQKS